MTHKLHTSSLKADLLLIFTTFLWGTSFICMKVVMGSVSAFEAFFWRSMLAFIIYLPWWVKEFKPLQEKGNWKKAWRAAAVLSFFNGVGLILQSWGLQLTTATGSAFVTSLHVFFTPIYLWLFFKQNPTKKAWACIAIAFLGLIIFTIQPDWTIQKGDFLVLLSAMLFGMAIIYTTRFTEQYSPFFLMGAQLLFLGLMCMAGWGWEGFHLGARSIVVWSNLIYLTIFVTLIGFYLQFVYQKQTEITRAILIYSLEPVFAAILGYFILTERLEFHKWVGAALMFGAVIASELKWNHFVGNSNKNTPTS